MTGKSPTRRPPPISTGKRRNNTPCGSPTRSPSRSSVRRTAPARCLSSSTLSPQLHQEILARVGHAFALVETMGPLAVGARFESEAMAAALPGQLGGPLEEHDGRAAAPFVLRDDQVRYPGLAGGLVEALAKVQRQETHRPGASLGDQAG